MVSSGPPAGEGPTTKPEDIAAQSGSHPAKVEKQPAEVKPIDKPVEVKPVTPTETGSSQMIYIIIVLIVVAAIVGVYFLTRG